MPNEKPNFDRKVFFKLAGIYSKKNSPESLHDLVIYLDSCGYTMPKYKYKYDPDDKKTHKYLSGKVAYDIKNKVWRYKSILNPHYRKEKFNEM